MRGRCSTTNNTLQGSTTYHLTEADALPEDFASDMRQRTGESGVGVEAHSVITARARAPNDVTTTR